MTDIDSALARYDTFPKLLLRNAEQHGDKTAYREKDYGIWQSLTWREAADMARELGLGLVALGLKRGDKVAIVGSNRPQLYIAFDAIEGVGGVPVPLYADSVAQEMQYVLHHAETRFALCEDQEQIDKLLSIKDGLPALEALIYTDPKGMRHYTQPFVHSFEAARAKGEQYDASHPGFWRAEVAKGTGDDLCLIAYTSGTTGNPKGVMLRAGGLIEATRLAIEMEGKQPCEEMIAYLPLAWVGDHFFSFAMAHVGVFTVNCPESSDTLMLDMRDIGPTTFISPPAIFENLLTQIQIRMQDASAFKRKIFDVFMGVARRVGVKLLEGKPVGLFDRLAYAMGELLVFGPLKDNLGFSRAKWLYTGGAPLGEEVFDFYRSIGLNLKQLYGQTESSAYCCIQRNGDVKRDTVGPACPSVELRISPDGEVLYKSPGTFIGYFKNDEATRETLEPDGWVHTGDAGIIDDTGHLKIIDRAKDVGTLNDGTLFAPQYIENKLKFFPYIKEAVAHGDKRDYVTAFINIDLEAVGNWAERQGLSYTSYSDLASLEPVYGEIRRCIEEVNRSLAADSALAGSQVRRFLLLHKELDADDGELTRTRKVRRRIIAERYGSLIDALYSDASEVHVATEVTFEDGRKGKIEADLKIAAADVFAPGIQRAA